MKNLLLSILLLIAGWQSTFAATILPTHGLNDSTIVLNLVPDASRKMTSLAGHKMSFWQKLQWKILQKKWNKKIKKEKDPQATKDIIATIALISGIAGIIVLFLVPVLGFVLMLGGIVTGIIGMKDNANSKSKTRALIGLIAGAAGVVLVGAIILAFASIFN